MADNKQGLDGPTLLDLYKVHIEYTRHENELLHQRVTWLLAVQGAAVAAMSLSMQKYFDIILRFSWSADAKALASLMPAQIVIWGQFAIYWTFIALIGIGAAQQAIRPVRAARKAQTEVARRWNQQFRERARELGFPDLMGGGLASAEREGGDFAVNLPRIFVWAWLVVLLIVLGSSYPLTQLRVWSFVGHNLYWFPLFGA